MIGQTISHYKITEKLGEGGMGVVYKARDTKLDRTVALKFLPSSLTTTEEDRQRFIREAKAAAALSHPNICTIYNIDEHEDTPFIVMEYIEGETLRAKIDSRNLTLETALAYAKKIASALADAHEQDIVHRDIKPENIMVDAKGRIKVMDFGLAKLKQARDITKTGDTVGTLAYMSPEQIRGQQVDHRSDLFSLGIVLYEMLTGQIPFQGEHQAAMTYSIVNEEPAPLEMYLQDVPEELEQFFGKTLVKDPQERFSKAGEIVEILESIKEIIKEPTVNASASAMPSSDKTNDSSTSSSSTIPKLSFWKNAFGRRVLLGGAAALLIIVLLASWWVMGKEPLSGEGEPTITERSVAVLPFSAFGQEEPGPFTEGIHDDLLTRLSNVGDLQVNSRASVERFRDSELSPPAIADSLGVRWIVDGRVQEADGQVQVYAQLIDPETDVNRWADSYQRELTAENLFDIQGDIAQKIAGALQAELSEGEQERITKAPTQNLEAYRHYVRGRRMLGEPSSAKNLFKAGQHFRQALEEDSTYALAWAGLANAVGSGLYQEHSPRTLQLPEVTQMQAARRALKLDHNLAEAHAALGRAHIANYDAPEALESLQRAVELKPSYALARSWFGVLWLITGRPESGLEHASLATNLSPDHYIVHSVYEAALFANEKYEAALAEGRRHLEKYPKQQRGKSYISKALIHLRRWDEVREFIRQHQAEQEETPGWVFYSNVLTDAAAGDTSSALGRVRKISSQGHRWESTVLFAALGKVDRAYEILPSVKDWPIYAFWNVRYDFPDLLSAFRSDPRYDELIRRVNEYWGLNPDGSIPDEFDVSENL